jgi:hypothetical protein
MRERERSLSGRREKTIHRGKAAKPKTIIDEFPHF